MMSFGFNATILKILVLCVFSVCIASTASVSNSNAPITIFQDFKAVLMYFSEAFLKGAIFGNNSLESEIPLVAPRKFIHVIKLLEEEHLQSNVDDTKFKRLVEFRQQLEAGLQVASRIQNLSGMVKLLHRISTPTNTISKCKEIQNFVISYLDQKSKDNGIIIPTGWLGHATVLVIKNSEVGRKRYDLTYINTGQGLQYHYHGPDPNNVYPSLPQLWIEFKCIPEDLLFDPQSAWLFYALYSIREDITFISNVKDSLKNEDSYLEDYFYGSILANFREYLVEPNVGISEKLFPAQRSGSCAMSSLMGALLYHSDSMESFHWYRLKIGHILLGSFLDRLELNIYKERANERNLLETDEDDEFEFISNMRDAFHSGGVRLFQGLVGALSKMQLQHLEHKFPDEFKNAGLIGPGRSTWIMEKKLDAMARLESDRAGKLELEKMFQLAERINTIISNIQYRPETIHIQDFSEIREILREDSIYSEKIAEKKVRENNALLNLRFDANDGRNIYRIIIEGVPERLEIDAESLSIDSFNVLLNSFEELFHRNDDHKEVYFMRFLDIFRRLRAGAGWSLIHNHRNKAQLLSLQELCKKLAYKFAKLSNNYAFPAKRKFTMDEITFAGHLQSLSWNLFRALHSLIDPDIEWDALIPPSTIQNLILPSKNHAEFISGEMSEWLIKGFNDFENYRLYQLFIEEGHSEAWAYDKQNNNFFPGPEILQHTAKYETKLKEFMKDKNLKAIFEKFMNLPDVERNLNRLKSESADWVIANENFAKFWIVLSAGQEELYGEIPHYYNLMYTLNCIESGIVYRGIKLKNNNNNEKFWLETAKKPGIFGHSITNGQKILVFPLTAFNYPLKLFNDMKSAHELFYALRHSYTLTEGVGMTDIDTWFNYIRNAKSSRIFDNPYFQYMTDHLLNIPKYKERTHESVLPFDAKFAQKVILELIKLIRLTLKKLLGGSFRMSISFHEQIVRRVLNISVITTRFISRVDYEFGASVESIDWAMLLAKLYNTIEPYSYLNSPVVEFTDLQVSMLNFALSHMCFTSLRIPDNFTKAIQLRFDYPFKRHRRTLARVHWFIAKMNYALSGDETIADDQFKSGFLGSPLKQEEIRFFEALLKEKFLRPFLQVESDYSFLYESRGYVVEIVSQSQIPKKLLINLATGTIIENGLLFISNLAFINSYEFQTYFPPEDQKYLRRVGKAFLFHGAPIFRLPVLHDSDYVIIQHLDKFWLLRRWNGNWYIWRPQETCKSLFDTLGYNWQGILIKIFKKYRSTLEEEELIIFDEGGKDPILQVTKNTTLRRKNYYSSYLVNVPGLTDEIAGRLALKKDYLKMHLREFAEEGIIFTKQKVTGTCVVIYNNHRLPNDTLKPFVIYTSSDNKLLVRNTPNMEICKDQRIGTDRFGVPGILVASFDEKRVLLVPFAEVLKKSKNIMPTARTYIMIETIPMEEIEISQTENIFVPAPQSRLHKLLLAYYMILAQNYDSARKLLHPSYSIHHNSMLSKEELQIILWIQNIKMESPEFATLSLITHSHFLINDAKFSFGYKQELYNLVKNVKSFDSSMVFDKYMMSIRELSEKYYIFKIFPEILDENSVLSKTFFSCRDAVWSSKNARYSEKFEFPTSFPSKSELVVGGRLTIRNFYDLMRTDSALSLEFNLIKYLLVRSSAVVKFDYSFEMAMYCYSKKPELWLEFKRILGENGSQFLKRFAEIKRKFEDIMFLCRHNEKFNDEFEGISFASISNQTDLKDIQATMKDDLRSSEYFRGEENDNLILNITEEEKDKILLFRASLMNRINETGNHHCDVELGFDPLLIESSTVLGGLTSSIRSFITENGRNHSTTLNFATDEGLFTELRDLTEILATRIDFLERELQNLTDILLIETYPDSNNSSLSNSIEKLFTLMHQRKQKTFNDLYACYMKDSLSCIQKKFPQLTLDQCRKVRSDSVLFFGKSILLDYLEMIQKSAQYFVRLVVVPVDDLMVFCTELEKMSDFDERIQNPVIMNFEFRSKKYRLKSEQVKDIELLTSEESGNFKSVVIQRMMAAGKTLVLGTISVVMKALKRNNTLSILVPPSSLYQSNTTEMQIRTYKYFKKKGHTFNFPRLPNLSNDDIAIRISNFLDNVISIMSHTMESKNYLILSPDCLQSFLNSYIEAIEGVRKIYNLSNYKVYFVILKKFATIYQIFKERSSIILDEIDMTLDPKKELNFPTTETETYNMTAVMMLADIIEFMLFDQETRNAGLNIFTNNQAAITLENYEKCKGLVLDYIQSQLQIENSLWRKFIPEKASSNAMKFLRSEKISDGKDWIIKLSTKNYAELANALVIVKTQLYLHLEKFLGATVNQNYGNAGALRPEIKYAVPYVAANTPSTESVFADRWETLIKTIIMISASSCSFEIAKDVIKYVRKSLTTESAYNSGSVNDIRSSPTFINMTHILPKNFDIMALDENEHLHVTIVHGAIKYRSPAAIRVLYSYYINEVFAKMQFPIEQITSNALYVTNMFTSVQGYSGTIDNVNILPHRVVEAAFKDHEENEKNNGGIALKLIHDFGNEIIPELNDEAFALEVTEMMQYFFRIFENNNVSTKQISAIIDTGAFFKNYRNKAVAEAILKHFNGRIKVILYYDEASNKLEFVKGVFDSGNLVSTSIGFLDTTDPEDIEKITQTGIDERFTFYDQRHITGSDIIQPKSALAIMTAGPRVLLRDILQGTLRMRQFMTSQKVHLIVTESSRKFYNSKISQNKSELHVSDLITLGSLNEDEKQIHENEKLAFRKIDAEIRSIILDEISKHLLNDHEIDFDRIMRLYHENRNIFIRSIKEDPISWLYDRKPQNTESVLQQHVALRLANLIPFFNTPEERSRLGELTAKLEAMYKSENENSHDSLLKFLKKDINVWTDGSNETGNEMIVVAQTQILTLVDMAVNLEQFIDKKDVNLAPKSYKYTILADDNDLLLRSSYGPVYSIDCHFFNLQFIYDRQPQSVKALVDSVLLSDGSFIGVTTDLLQLYEIARDSNNQFPIFSKYTLEGTHFLIFSPRNCLDEPRVLLLSPRHAASAFTDIKTKTHNKYRLWLCDLFGDVKISNESENFTTKPVENIFQIDYFKAKVKRLIFDLLIFNGSFTQILSNPDLRTLYENEWIKAASFKNRALFLRLRMKVLAEKDAIIFDEDDPDYSKLKKYSLGDPQTLESKSEIFSESYSKCAISLEMQKAFVDNNPSVFDTKYLYTDGDFNNLISSSWEESLAEVFSGISNNNDESVLRLSRVELAAEQQEQKLTNEFISDDKESIHLVIRNDLSTDFDDDGYMEFFDKSKLDQEATEYKPDSEIFASETTCLIESTANQRIGA